MSTTPLVLCLSDVLEQQMRHAVYRTRKFRDLARFPRGLMLVLTSDPRRTCIAAGRWQGRVAICPNGFHGRAMRQGSVGFHSRRGFVASSKIQVEAE